MQCYHWGSRQHCSEKKSCAMLFLDQHCSEDILCTVVFEAQRTSYVLSSLRLRGHPMYCRLWGSRQHCTRKKPVQCCLNTLGITLHRPNPTQCCPRGCRRHCTEKNSCNVVLIFLRQYCTGKTLCSIVWEALDNITQEKVRWNVVWTTCGHFSMTFILNRLIFW